jgi:AraC-like DNA-binding protein
MLRLRCSRPAAGLEHFVRFYVQREIRIRGTPVVHKMAARVCPMIEFSFGDPVNIVDHEAGTEFKCPTSVVLGPQTFRRLDMRLQGDLVSFAIMFQPDGLHRLFSIPMHELTDRGYEAHSVCGTFMSIIRQRLGNLESFEERVDFVDELLWRRSLGSNTSDGISDGASRILCKGGRILIPSLAGTAGLSVRQFERRFIVQVGLRPKLFAKIARFQAALEGKARFTRKTWTDVAHQCGYHDQMHMIHDFSQLTGGTPSEALTQMEADPSTTSCGSLMTDRGDAPAAVPATTQTARRWGAGHQSSTVSPGPEAE